MRKVINRNTIRLILIILLIISLTINFGFNTHDLQPSVLTFTEQPVNNYVFRKLIHISGEVSNPGVYEVSKDTRVSEIIEIAGGLTDEANISEIHISINLAKTVEDGEKIYIPKSGSNLARNTVNLNTSTQKELEKLPGIGPVTASHIINIRPIISLSDLAKIKSFSEKKILEIKDLVSL